MKTRQPAVRTTIAIDRDVLDVARSLAAARRTSVGRALTDLARRGLERSDRVVHEEGFPVVAVSAAAAPITSEMVAAVLDEE